MKHCFVIPVYNHPHYLAALLSHLSSFELPIIMVNDGSDAACTAVLHQLAHDYAMVDLVGHTQNQGKGQAVITGLKHAFESGYSHALQLDADGQHDWKDVQRFFRHLYPASRSHDYWSADF
jgi:glycosyltransferase involved in cell wall biosynthesis